ncbi:MAG: Tat pathway signal protein [Pseudomonadota bacterium]
MSLTTGCGADRSAYDERAAQLRAELAADPSLTELVRYATLAPNSHNTQPWRFQLSTNEITILPDFSRRTPAVDPDDHHLYVSLGCAAENLAIAAHARGRPSRVVTVETNMDGEDARAIKVSLGNGPAQNASLCEAIPMRQSTRSEYDGRALSADDLILLKDATSFPGVTAVFLTDGPKLEDTLEFVVAGNSRQMDTPEFVDELMAWIRFSHEAALRTGDGLSGPCSGNPSAPDWLGKRFFHMAFKKPTENDKYAKQIRSSAGVVVFIADKDGPEGWIRVGRSFERFALQATLLGIQHAHINQPIEVPEVRSGFADWLGMTGRRPNLVIRFGNAPMMPMSLRRPTKDVILV